MKKTLLLIVFGVFGYSGLNAQNYYVVTSEDDSLNVVNSAGVVQSKTKITEASQNTISGFTGMSEDPTSGTIYVVVKHTTRYLATLDVSNNQATKVADLSVKISSIAFDANGALYGISGDGATPANNFYSINKTNGALTQLADFSADLGDDGEGIGYNSTDGFMYRLAGGSYLYKIDLQNNTESLVTDMLTDDGISGHALYYNGTNFISMSGDMCTMDAMGVQTNCNNLDYDAKGILLQPLVSINENTVSEELKIYPNPAKDNFTINVPANTKSNTLQILDFAGKVVLTSEVKDVKNSIDVSALAKGVYVVTLGELRTKLVVE